MSRLSALKSKIVGKTSDVLSYPTRAIQGVKKANREAEVNVLKTARSMKGMPKFEVGKGVTDAFKYQSAAEGIKSKYKK